MTGYGYHNWWLQDYENLIGRKLKVFEVASLDFFEVRTGYFSAQYFQNQTLDKLFLEGRYFENTEKKNLMLYPWCHKPEICLLMP